MISGRQFIKRFSESLLNRCKTVDLLGSKTAYRPVVGIYGVEAIIHLIRDGIPLKLLEFEQGNYSDETPPSIGYVHVQLHRSELCI